MSATHLVCGVGPGINNVQLSSSGCDAVGRAVVSETRDPRFKSSHRQFCSFSTVLKRRK